MAKQTDRLTQGQSDRHADKSTTEWMDTTRQPGAFLDRHE